MANLFKVINKGILHQTTTCVEKNAVYQCDTAKNGIRK